MVGKKGQSKGKKLTPSLAKYLCKACIKNVFEIYLNENNLTHIFDEKILMLKNEIKINYRSGVGREAKWSLLKMDRNRYELLSFGSPLGTGSQRVTFIVTFIY
jgi:hypothetical protein